MQDIITKAILQHSLVPYKKANKIITALFEANYELPDQIAERRPSFLNFENVLKWGGSVENAHVASLSALNSKHGCFGDAYDLIDVFCEFGEPLTKDYICNLLNSGNAIPGFGNPIYKGFNSDPRCQRIRNVLYDTLPSEVFTESLIALVRELSLKDIDANLVFWNAACIYLLGLPRECASLVFILATQIRYINESIKSTVNQPDPQS
jgi:hypothetical protein